MRAIKKILKKILIALPMKKMILMESIPDLSDNTKAVFDEMLARGVNKRWKIVWFVKSCPKKFPKIKNVKYYNYNTSWGRFCLFLTRYKAKCIVCCNSFYPTLDKRQKSFYLSHGTPLKSVRSYYTIPPNMDYAFSASNGVKELYAYELNYDANRVRGLGYPRNDALTEQKTDIKKILKTNCEKVIVWYPTFRQHKNGGVTGSEAALPIIHDALKAETLNDFAKAKNILIVVKPHFAQNLSYIKDTCLSNIMFINDDFFTENKISSYQFVGNCDALISDYSSIYYDFLLCNKPIGFVWEDLEEYKKNPGLVENYEYWSRGAEKIYTLDDFCGFVDRISNNIDVLERERQEINEVANYASDGKNSQRVLDFIMEKIEKKEI